MPESLCPASPHPAGLVSNADFDNAILRAVAGIEKKRSVLQVRAAAARPCGCRSQLACV